MIHYSGRHRMDNRICSKCYSERGRPYDVTWSKTLKDNEMKRFCWAKFDCQDEKETDFYVAKPPKECKYYLEQLMLKR